MMKEPKQSCPEIDGCIRNLQSADDNLTYAAKRLNDLEYDLGEGDRRVFKDTLFAMSCAQSDLDIFSILEDVRQINSDLRDWGKHLESELLTAEQYIKELENEK
jgi:hypothetical protein